MKIVAIVAAAGSGRRLGSRLSKPYLNLNNQPLVSYSLCVLEQTKQVDQIVLVVEKRQLLRAKDIVRQFKISKIRAIIKGGRTRSESVRYGLKCVDKDTDFVLIHDGARPFITPGLVTDCIKAGTRHEAAICAIPCSSTIKSVNKRQNVTATLNRNTLWQVQTPQVFSYNLINRAYNRFFGKEKLFFDDAALVERLPHKVKVIPGLYENIKITTKEDLKIAQALLKCRDNERTTKK